MQIYFCCFLSFFHTLIAVEIFSIYIHCNAGLFPVLYSGVVVICFVTTTAAFRGGEVSSSNSFLWALGVEHYCSTGSTFPPRAPALYVCYHLTDSTWRVSIRHASTPMTRRFLFFFLIFLNLLFLRAKVFCLLVFAKLWTGCGFSAETRRETSSTESLPSSSWELKK